MAGTPDRSWHLLSQGCTPIALGCCWVAWEGVVGRCWGENYLGPREGPARCHCRGRQEPASWEARRGVVSSAPIKLPFLLHGEGRLLQGLLPPCVALWEPW